MHPVTWTPQAERELKRLWKSAANPVVIGEAARRLEAALEDDPVGNGSQFSDDLYCLLDWPLAVLYKLEADDSVLVTQVYQLDEAELN